MTQETASRSLLTLAAVVVLLAGLRAAALVVVPVLLALFLAFVSSPLVFRLARTRVPYALAVALVLFFELCVLGVAGLLVGTSAQRLQERLPLYQQRLGDLFTNLATWLGAHGANVRPQRFAEALDAGRIVDLVGSAVASLGAALSSIVLVVLVLAFTLFDASRLWRKLDEHISGGTAGDRVLSTISHDVNRYIGVKTATSVATGVLLGLWCMVMKVDFPILWGLLAFLLNYIPNVGSIVATIPPFVVALLMQGLWPALFVMLGYFVVNTIIGNVIEPRLFGAAFGMSPVVVLLSIILWGWVLGPVGAILSVPVTMVFKIVLSNTRDWVWVADLMGGDKGGHRPVPRIGPRPRDGDSPEA